MYLVKFTYIFMSKHILVSVVVGLSALACLFVVKPADAATATFRQHTTYADYLVQTADAFNTACSKVIDAVVLQNQGVTTTEENEDIFGNYFGCLMSQSLFYYTQHWTPPAQLKSVHTKLGVLANGLVDFKQFFTATGTVQNISDFKVLVKSNQELLSAVKKEIAAVKKKYPAVAKADSAFAKRIAAKQNIKFNGSLKDTFSCGKDLSCFEKKYKSCSPAWRSTPMGDYSLEYRIVGKVKGGCQIKVTEKLDYLGLLAGKEMKCTYNNKKTFASEEERVGNEIVTNPKQKICVGSMVAYAQKYLDIFQINPAVSDGISNSIDINVEFPATELYSTTTTSTVIVSE